MQGQSNNPKTAATIPAANRRAFLAWSMKLGVVAAPALALARSASGQDVHTNGRRPRLGPKLPELYRGWNARNFGEIRSDEDTHVTALLNLLGSSARPKPTFQNLEATTYHQFALMSQAFENTGVGAYLGALPILSSEDLVKAAGSIALVEAYHSGYLNTLLNNPIVPHGANFATPFTIDQVVAAAGPFVASLNGGPPLTFDATPSAANDVKIANFALALEFLEKEFYDINVAKFYPGA